MEFLLRTHEPAGSDSPGVEEWQMHPGFIGWWHARREAMRAGGCGPFARPGGGPGGGGGCEPRFASGHDDGGFEGGAFGVRRPLRFLAYKLELDEKQVDALARVLDDLKTERAQAAVDHRRSTSALADAIEGASFDEGAVNEVAGSRVKSAERLRDAVVKALGRIHAILTPEQRGKLAYLLRTGALQM
jgi:Spy/CpxP family protein refolding chaperone